MSSSTTLHSKYLAHYKLVNLRAIFSACRSPSCYVKAIQKSRIISYILLNWQAQLFLGHNWKWSPILLRPPTSEPEKLDSATQGGINIINGSHTGSLPANLHIFFFMQLKAAAFELRMPTSCTKDTILKGCFLCHFQLFSIYLTTYYLFLILNAFQFHSSILLLRIS